MLRNEWLNHFAMTMNSFTAKYEEDIKTDLLKVKKNPRLSMHAVLTILQNPENRKLKSSV
jgi:hypothetical protein